MLISVIDKTTKTKYDFPDKMLDLKMLGFYRINLNTFTFNDEYRGTFMFIYTLTLRWPDL